MWHVVIPLKTWDTAKSRLAVPSPTRGRLVQAMAADTLTAISGCQAVAAVTVLVSVEALLTSQVLGLADHALVQPEDCPTINSALRWAVRGARLRGLATAILPGDLPALRAEALTTVLEQAAGHSPCAFVADRKRSGTTLLAALRGADLQPMFGAASADRHRAAGATEILGPPVLRCDVDTLEDLRIALDLGVGPSTQAAVVALADSLPWPP